jgi:hypothetical protein
VTARTVTVPSASRSSLPRSVTTGVLPARGSPGLEIRDDDEDVERAVVTGEAAVGLAGDTLYTGTQEAGIVVAQAVVTARRRHASWPTLG